MTSADEGRQRVTVRLPAQLPVLSREASRILLAILVDLAEVEVLERPLEWGGCDC